MRKSRFSEEQISGILKRVERGQTRADVCRAAGSSAATSARWKAQYGGLEVNQVRRLRQLEDEQRQLQQVVADVTLDHRALKDVVATTGERPRPVGGPWAPGKRPPSAPSGAPAG
ncbi:MAG TPA: transposase [Ktedonobacterales bacterium]|nr:transposase [Ktedonobacterales bacterium]